MRNLNRIVPVKSAKTAKPQKPLTNSILVYLKWPCLILKCVGLLPFYTTHSLYEIGAPNQRSIKINRAILFTKTVLNMLHIYAFLSPTIMELLFIRSKTDGITNLLDVVFCMLSDFTITWTCASSGAEFVLIINNLLKVDKLLKQYPDSPAERPYASNKFNRYLFWIFGYISFIMIGYVKRTLDYFSFYFCIYITFYQLENAISCGFVVFISAFLHLLSERFRFVNQLIAQYNSKILQHKAYPTIFSFDRKAIAHDAANLRLFAENSTMLYSLHIDLLDIYKRINNYAGLGLLVFLLYSCYGLLSCAYGCFVSDWQTADDLYYVIWTFSWIPLYTVVLILLATNCAKATREVGNDTQLAV